MQNINGVVQRAYQDYLKWQGAVFFVQTVRRGSWMRSVQCCTSDRCLSQCECECECECVCVCVFVWVVVVGWGSEFSDSWGKRGEGGARTGGSSASWQPGGWSCLSVCLSWLGDSSVSSLMVADWRSCVSGGWDHLQCWGLCGWDGCCKCPGGRGERHQRSSQLLSLSVEGTCGRTRCRRHTCSDAASQNALDGASVEGAHDGGRGSGSS